MAYKQILYVLKSFRLIYGYNIFLFINLIYCYIIIYLFIIPYNTNYINSIILRLTADVFYIIL